MPTRNGVVLGDASVVIRKVMRREDWQNLEARTPKEKAGIRVAGVAVRPWSAPPM
jgi:hypothetical protein